MSLSPIGAWLHPEITNERTNRARVIESLELITPQPAIDGNDGAGDVAGARRDEEADEVREILGLAVFADRDVLFALLLPELGRVVAQDLLCDDAPGRDRVDRDAGLADLSRKPLRPGVHRRFPAEGAYDALGLWLACDVDDTAPVARHHLRQQLVSKLALPREVERKRLVPLLLARLEREAPAAAGVVDEDLHRAEPLQRRLRDFVG